MPAQKPQNSTARPPHPRNAVANILSKWQQSVMSSRPPIGQLFFNFEIPPLLPNLEAVEGQRISLPVAPASGRDPELEKEARQWLDDLGIHEGAIRLQVHWNPRLRSTAGYAQWPHWLVELNPKLADFEGQVIRTLKHEVAHLIAYARAGRRRIDPHGPEWRQACADLGIPDESARHTLPLPRSKRERRFIYRCPACNLEVRRVKPFRRHSACLSCCRQHNRGQYDARFQFRLIHSPNQSASPPVSTTLTNPQNSSSKE